MTAALGNLQAFIANIYNSREPDTEDFNILAEPRFTLRTHLLVGIRILRDHMIFINDRSKVYADQAGTYLAALLSLRQNVLAQRGDPTSEYINEAIRIVDQIHNFKRNILAELMDGPPNITLPATFISHMLNELEKFRFLLYYVRENGTLPEINALNEHKLWLLDSEGHLQGIEDNLDPIEKLLRKRLCKQKKVFKALHAKALEAIGYVKHGVVGGNHLLRLHDDSRVEVVLYLNLVNEIRELREQNLALGTINTHMLLHMLFEEIYYLRNLEQADPNRYDPFPNTQMQLDPRSEAAVKAMSM